MNEETDLLARVMLALWDWRDANTDADDDVPEKWRDAVKKKNNLQDKSWSNWNAIQKLHS